MKDDVCDAVLTLIARSQASKMSAAPGHFSRYSFASLTLGSVADTGGSSNLTVNWFRRAIRAAEKGAQTRRDVSQRLSGRGRHGRPQGRGRSSGGDVELTFLGRLGLIDPESIPERLSVRELDRRASGRLDDRRLRSTDSHSLPLRGGTRHDDEKGEGGTVLRGSFEISSRVNAGRRSRATARAMRRQC